MATKVISRRRFARTVEVAMVALLSSRTTVVERFSVGGSLVVEVVFEASLAGVHYWHVLRRNRFTGGVSLVAHSLTTQAAAVAIARAEAGLL
jgi:hypothetical protein